MRHLCPKCNILSSENAIACARCGTPFLPANQTHPTESPAPPQGRTTKCPQGMAPGPQPDEFAVKRSGNELTISWGTSGWRRASAVGIIALSLALLGLSITTTAGAYTVVLMALLVVGAVYWLIAMYANRTILRLGDGEWVISRGPVPLPNPDLSHRSERRFDPRRYERVVAVKTTRSGYSSGGTGGSDWVDVFIELVFWLVHHMIMGGRVTFTVYGSAPLGYGHRDELVTGLKERQATYLATKLQSLLDADAQPVEETRGAAQDTAVQPACAEPALDFLAEAAEDGLATGGDGTEEAGSLVSCPSCGAANPADSAFCGECGAALEGSEW